MGNGMNKVIDGLYLGNIRDSENRESLSKYGITHILSVCNNAKPVLEDMTYLCIHAADASNQNLLQHFKECIRFIHECRLSGGACLVHCLAGVSRSTTMVVAYLMTVTTYGWEECLSAVKAVRSFVGPNCGFQQQLQQFQRTQLSEVSLQPSAHIISIVLGSGPTTGPVHLMTRSRFLLYWSSTASSRPRSGDDEEPRTG
ncbi:dual specificity protein phosphatase 22-A isoform X2 [Silurus meridionalis]|uniref:dual specificity protein phosphatase 22-A isoform X2 n=1 Tax=Silurus meridionalis TaxID=175797 RepID=UPI001EEBF55F|nr:dual specificity protein phosphatase 22-A isoform X2 [Silurus meridionalis]